MEGTTLRQYRLLSKLGEGGMGVVYLAEDTRLGRKVAIKLLPEAVRDDPLARRRFADEARSAAAIDHPYICQIHELARQEDVFFIVLEYVEGVTIQDLVARDPLPLERCLELGLEIADALEKAHAAGIVHRDLKPANIMVTEAGRGHAKVMDFGLAKRLAAPAGAADATMTRITVAGVVVGTPGYMAPEQIRGRQVDHRADIFSFGLVLYEMLTGEHPFLKSNPGDTAVALAADPAPPLGDSVAEAPPLLEHTIQKMLAKKPRQRYQSVREVKNNLAELLRPGSAPATAPARSSWRRRSGVAAAITLLALLGAWLVIQQADRSPVDELREPQPAAAEWDVPVDPASLAILPFDNLTGEPENDYFVTGIEEGVARRISGLSGLRVTARPAVAQYRGPDRDLARIAREQRVATLLTGAVRERREDRVSVELALVDPRSGDFLWRNTYHEAATEIFAIESGAAAAVARALDASIGSAERERLGRAPTTSQSAYEAYLKGRQRYERYTREDNEEAIRLFRRAVELDPGYALARAGLADAYSQRVHQFGFDEMWLDTAAEVAREAVASGPEIAEAYKALGLALAARGRLSAALEANLAAVEINPNYYPALANVGFTLLVKGRGREALGWFRKALAIAPLQPFPHSGVGFVYLFLDDYQRAESWFRRALELEPAFVDPHVGLTCLYLTHGEYDKAREVSRSLLEIHPAASALAGDVELYSGRLDEARDLFERATTSGPIDSNRLLVGRPKLATVLAYVHLRSGQEAEAGPLFERSLSIGEAALDGGWEFPGLAVDVAAAQAALGNSDAALAALRRAVDAGFVFYRGAQTDPLLATLRGEPEFERLVSTLRQRAEAERAALALDP